MSDQWDGNERRSEATKQLAEAKSEVALLRGEVTVLSAQAKKLASKEEVHDMDERTKRRFYYVILPIVALLLIGVVNLVTIQKIDDSTQKTKENTEAIQTLTHRIDDCLDPNGKCGKESAERTQAAVAQIVNEIVKALEERTS